MQYSSIKHILFDLDGTLTDPQEGIVRSILYALEQMGIEESNPEQLRSFIGPPLRDSFQLRYQLSLHDATLAVAHYRDYFGAKGLYENKVYDGIPELLRALHADGRMLYLASSKPTVYCEKILEHFELRSYFREVAGSHLDNSRTDKAEIIAYLLHTHDLDPESCVMVGDRQHDCVGARAHGMPVIGVCYGYGTEQELLSSGANNIATSPIALNVLLLSKVQDPILQKKHTTR